MKNKLRIVHNQNHDFKFEHRIGSEWAELYTGKGEWVAKEFYRIERRVHQNWLGKETWEPAGFGHWYKRDTFGTFEEAKEALKYYDGTIQKETVVWESE